VSRRSGTSRAREENPTLPPPSQPAKDRVYSDAEIEAALLATHGIIKPAAERLGCARFTIQQRIDRSPDYWRPRIAQFREGLIDAAENVLADSVLGGDVQSAIYLLKTVGKSRGYSERTEVTGADGGDLVLTIRPPTRPADG